MIRRAILWLVPLASVNSLVLWRQPALIRNSPARRRDGVSMAAAPRQGAGKDRLGKERVAVCGAGGRVGAYLFGMLQRAAPNNIYSGLGDPRAIVGTQRGSMDLNNVLTSSFILAFASENMIRLASIDEEETLTKA